MNLLSLLLNIIFYYPKLLFCFIFYKIFNYYRAQQHRTAIKQSKFQPNIVIIGAGFSGICIAYHLKHRLGYNNFTIYEKHSEVGGTWSVNQYPGCCCDINGFFYSFSFAPNYSMKKAFPTQAETLEYQKYICNKFDLNKHIQFNSEVTQLSYNQQAKQWTVSIQNRNEQQTQTVIANIVIPAVGQLSKKRVPKFAKLHDFEGPVFHSAEWDTTFSCKDSTIGVIGTAPSAIQIIPEIYKTAKKLVVFQRSASHCVPKVDFNISPLHRLLLKYLPFYYKFWRYLSYFIFDCLMYPCIYNKWWNQMIHREFYLKYINAVFRKRPVLKQQIDPPKHQPVFTKRIMVSSDYYHILKKPTVELITNPIESFSKTGIVVDRARDYTLENAQPLDIEPSHELDYINRNTVGSNGYHHDDEEEEDGTKNSNSKRSEKKLETIALDCVVLATGFESQSFLGTIKNDVIGKNGLHLRRDVWKNNNALAYLGMTVADFPNLFLLYGPGTNLATGSILFMIECSSFYITECISSMIRYGWDEIEVKRTIMKDFVESCDLKLKDSVWSTKGVRNWYTNYTGRIPSNWAYNMAYYWWLTTSFVANQYDISYIKNFADKCDKLRYTD